MKASGQGGRLIVASNRLPFTIQDDASGETVVHPSSGGLVTAMAPLLQRHGGVWVGWPGTVDVPQAVIDEKLSGVGADAGYTARPVALSSAEHDAFYYGFSNEVVWPLFHGLHTTESFDPAFWESYVEVNRRFADAICEVAKPKDFVWVHDYHLMCVGSELRRRKLSASTGFFLHIPFPGPDVFLKLPWRREVLEGLLSFDLIGFQTQRDEANFRRCVETLVGARTGTDGGRFTTFAVGSAASEDEVRDSGVHDVRIHQSGTFPIGIDAARFERMAMRDDVEQQTHRLVSDLRGRKLILGVDRLDYTKGIPNRLEAFREALRNFPELRRRVTFVQHVVPSRESIQRYYDLRLHIERLVSDINGRFSEPGWVPVHYMHHSLQPSELVAYYRAADIALVTPLADGMNLIAKEYCASRVDERGVLILSEFAGAASQLEDAPLLVNPYDVRGTADAIRAAFSMAPEEQAERMRRMRENVHTQDVFWWANNYLDAARHSTPQPRAASADIASFGSWKQGRTANGGS